VSANLSVVKIHETTLRDIPGRLRMLADKFDANPDSVPRTFVWVQYSDDGEVTPGAFGDNPSKAEVVGILTLAAGMFTAEPSEIVCGAG
jgi:hypothetical protein